MSYQQRVMIALSPSDHNNEPSLVEGVVLIAEGESESVARGRLIAGLSLSGVIEDISDLEFEVMEIL